MLTNLAELDRQLAAQKSCQRLSVEGGWYAVLRVPVTQTDEELTVELLRKKSVLVHPGHFYDFPSDGYLVLSLITPRQEFAEAVRRVLETLNFGASSPERIEADIRREFVISSSETDCSPALLRSWSKARGPEPLPFHRAEPALCRAAIA